MVTISTIPDPLPPKICKRKASRNLNIHDNAERNNIPRNVVLCFLKIVGIKFMVE